MPTKILQPVVYEVCLDLQSLPWTQLVVVSLVFLEKLEDVQIVGTFFLALTALGAVGQALHGVAHGDDWPLR